MNANPHIHETVPENTLRHNTKRGRTRKCRTCQKEANRVYRLGKLLATSREIT